MHGVWQVFLYTEAAKLILITPDPLCTALFIPNVLPKVSSIVVNYKISMIVEFRIAILLFYKKKRI